MATKEFKARYVNGVLEPLEELDLEEGTEVTVSVTGERNMRRIKPLSGESFGAWKGLVDTDELLRHVYESRSRPSDRPEPKL